MPVGFPVCTRHKDCRLKETAVRRLKAEMNQVAIHTAPEREGDDIKVQLVTIRLARGAVQSVIFETSGRSASRGRVGRGRG